jgi:hypothetical protein
MQIRRPEWLQLGEGNQVSYGYNQEWYKKAFQKTRGCGPTAAVMLLTYLNRRESEKLPYKTHNISAITKVMEEVWNFVTPGYYGLKSTGDFCKGIANLLQYYKINWGYRKLGVAALKHSRISLLEMVRFIEQGIVSDCPIAFLNLNRGNVTIFESWHWIVLVALSLDAKSGCYLATCYDNGRSITFDLGLWLETTTLGGGFVYFIVNDE